MEDKCYRSLKDAVNARSLCCRNWIPRRPRHKTSQSPVSPRCRCHRWDCSGPCLCTPCQSRRCPVCIKIIKYKFQHNWKLYKFTNDAHFRVFEGRHKLWLDGPVLHGVPVQVAEVLVPLDVWLGRRAQSLVRRPHKEPRDQLLACSSYCSWISVLNLSMWNVFLEALQ